MPLTVEHVNFSYGQRRVIADASFSVMQGDVVALTGPSGSGKTTLLQLIGGLLRPQSGAISGRLDPSAIRWVFQMPTALGRRTVIDNVLIGLLDRRLGSKEALSRAGAAVRSVGLSGWADRPANTLSGGELQRMQLARALVSEPELVLADEPTGQLDLTSTQDVVEALRSMSTRQSVVIVATHDPTVAGACDRVFDIRDGKVLEMGR